MSGWFDRLRNGTLVGGATIAGLLILHRIRKYLYQNRGNADELHHVTTEDDVELGLWRYRPEDPGEPVLLVHGLGCNHRHMDLTEELSLACYLRDRGFDCWAIDLRGRGASDRPEETPLFDDFVDYDIPASIDYILERTGYSKLHWCGHSMGAMIYHAFAGTSGYQDKIASSVAAEGPFHGRSSDRDDSTGETRAIGFESIFLPTLEFFRRLRIPVTGVARSLAFWYPQLKGVVPDQLMYFMVNPENVNHEILKKTSVRMIERVGPRILGQFLDWAVNRHWMNKQETLDYRDSVGDITVPTRVIAGPKDKLCPPHNQKAGFEELGSTEKDLVVAGKEEGFSVDYSHLDLVQGVHSADEIFPLFGDWFERYSIE